MTTRPDTLGSRWARAGVLLQGAPAAESPDLERLLLDTARAAPGNARLLALAATWLGVYGSFVARHRLRRLAVTELDSAERAVLGLILESAVSLGAPRELLVAAEACRPAAEPGPLYESHRGDPSLAALAERRASVVSRKWGVWAPAVEPRAEAVRPVAWVLARNPGYRERAVRKGDLRCSIVESLRRDAGGRARSESAVARLCGATRTAVRKALAALVNEGAVRVEKGPGNERDHSVVVLERAA